MRVRQKGDVSCRMVRRRRRWWTERLLHLVSGPTGGLGTTFTRRCSALRHCRRLERTVLLAERLAIVNDVPVASHERHMAFHAREARDVVDVSGTETHDGLVGADDLIAQRTGPAAVPSRKRRTVFGTSRCEQRCLLDVVGLAEQRVVFRVERRRDLGEHDIAALAA